MSEIPGQSGHALPSLQQPVCANSGNLRPTKRWVIGTSVVAPMDRPIACNEMKKAHNSQ
jgi:hypothetical protein